MTEAHHLNHLMHTTDALMDIMFKKPEDKMDKRFAYTATEIEYNAKLNDLADKYFPDEMAELFADLGSIREAIMEMSDAEIKLLLPEVAEACKRYFKPIAFKAALKRAELEMEEMK